MIISAEDRERISNAIRAAEAKTSGEIVCVLAQSSATATALPVFLAAIGALALPWAACDLHGDAGLPDALAANRGLRDPARNLLLVAGAGRADAAARARARGASRCHGAVHDPWPRAKKRAHRHIDLRFACRALCPHHCRRGISARVPQSQWQAAIDALVAHMRDGRIADGFVAAIDLCGSELAKAFPARRRAAMNCRIGSI